MMRKVAIFGLPGTGKTTLAGRLAGLLGVPCHDLDHVLFTDSGPLPLEEFRTRTAGLSQAGGWVVDGNYSKLADVTWHRADVVIWLDWKRAFFSRKSVLANAVRKYVRNRGKYAAQLAESAALGVRVFRFRTPRQAEKWLATVTSRSAGRTEDRG